jgi:hypothetical protein
VGYVWGPSMEKCRSFDLDSKQDDFAEPAEETCRLDFTDTPLVDPANYNSPKSEPTPPTCMAFRQVGALKY